MSKVKMPRITRVVPLPPLKLVLEFDDGSVVLADLRGVAERGGLFLRLLDDRYFKRAKIANGGRSLAWPNRLDFCADAFYVAQVNRRRTQPITNSFGAHIFSPAGKAIAA